MRRYAIWGTATSPDHEGWVRSVGKAFETDGFERVDDVANADFVLNMFDPEQPKAFRRQSRGTYSASFYELPEVPERWPGSFVVELDGAGTAEVGVHLWRGEQRGERRTVPRLGLTEHEPLGPDRLRRPRYRSKI